MPYHDEERLRQLQIRVQEELAQARADLERQSNSPSPGSDLGARLEQIERELTKLQRSRGLLFRGRRTREVQSLLLSERLVLDDLGYDSYAGYLDADVQARPLERDPGNAYAELARLELASAQARLTDIEDGVLDLDWLADGCPELSLVEPLEADWPSSVDGEAERPDDDEPLKAWVNPFPVAADPSPTTGLPSRLPQIDRDGSPRPVGLPYWKNESA